MSDSGEAPAFPKHDYLTVRELAALLRLKERKVYDLAASGRVPCSRATGKLLFPADQIRAWIAAAQGGAVPVTAPQPRLPIVLGSHDPLLDWALRQSGSGLATGFDGSRDGLDRFVAGEGIATGLHLRDAASGVWNVPAVQAAGTTHAALIGFARRRRGMVCRADGPQPRDMRALAGLRVVPRQSGAGTQALFEGLAAEAGLLPGQPAMAAIARTEDEAVQAVQRGEADVAFGLEAVARSHGLVFHPVLWEEFALLIDRKAWFDPQLQRFRAFCQTPAFATHAANLGGYDLTPLCAVLWNAPERGHSG